MKLTIRLCIITLAIFLNSTLTSLGQTDTVFWFAVPYATTGHDAVGADYYADLTISAKDSMFDTYIKISQPFNSNPLLPIYDTIKKYDAVTNPNPVLTKNINIPRALLTQISNNLYSTVQNSALLIQSSRKINAYYEYHRKNNNPDIFTLKGENALGTDFWVPFQNFWNNHTSRNPAAYSQINIVATKNNTQIQITFQKDADDYPANPLPAPTYTVTLQKGQTYQFVPKERVANRPNESGAAHLTGTHITSNEPIAVTIGDDSVIKISPNDYIGDQLVPVKNAQGKPTIGLEYVVMKGRASNNGGGSNEKVFVLTTQPNTTITYKRKSDAGYTTLSSPPNSAGTQYTIDLFDAHHFVHIEADFPVYVWHVTGIVNELGGAIVPTIDGCTGSKDVTFVRSKDWVKTYYNDFYLNIMTHADAIDSFKVSVDGGSFKRLYTSAAFEPVGIGDLYVLKRDSSLRNAFPSGVPIRVKNIKNVFHLGVINGISSGGGCAYGYFSDYTFFDVEGRIVESNTPILSTCFGNSVQLEVTEGHNSYQWSSPETPASVTYLDDPTIFNPSGVLPVGIHKFEVRVQGDCSLDDTLKGFVVEIFPAVDAKFTILPSSVGCAPYTIQIQNLSTVADKFSWDFEDDRIYDDFTANPAPHTYNNNFLPYKDTVYTLRLLAEKDTTYCADEYIRYVRVHPEIYAGFTQDKLIDCNPLDVVFTNTSTGNLDKYLWDFDGTSTSITRDATHRYVNDNPNDTAFYSTKMKVTSPYLCSDSVIKTFTVFPFIKGEFTIDKKSGCSPLTVNINNNSAGDDQLTLDFGDGTSYNYTTPKLVSRQHTYINISDTVQRRVVTLTATNDEGCTKIWRDTVTVYPEIRANYTLLPNQYTGCNSQNFAFTNASNASSIHVASSYLWTFGDGSTSNIASPTKVYNNTTTSDQPYTFTMRAQSQYGCWDDTTNTITIYRAYANFNLDTASGCSPLTVNITNTSVGNQIATWAWTFGDATNSGLQNPPAKLYTNTSGATQIRPLRLTVTGTGGCSTFKETNVSVYSSIDVSFTPLLPTVCDSVAIPFVSTIIHGTVNKYTWNFGDNTSSNAANFSKVYYNRSSAGNITYPASLKVETAEGCKDSANTTVTVRPYVNALYTIDRVSGCTPLTVNPVANQYLGIPANNYQWTLNAAPIHTGFDPLPYLLPVNPAPGPNANYTLRLNVSDPSGLCTDFMEKPITVYPAALADFTPFEVSGCNPFTIDFTNVSSSLVTSTFLWDFGDFTTFNGVDPAPKTFANETNITKPYKIKLKETTNYGCTHTDSANIYVYRKVEANFGIDISEGCSPVNVRVTSNSKGGTYRWYWNSQTGAGIEDSLTTNSSETFTHQYVNTTGSDITFYLTLVAQNAEGCTHTLTREILVHSSITAGFTFSQPDSCNASDVVFTNTSIGGGSYTMNWEFGDGTYRSVTNAVALDTIHKRFTNLLTTDKSFTVIMTASSENECTDTHQEIVTVFSRVEANINIPISQGCPNAVTQLFNATIKNTSVGNPLNTYEWYIDNVLVPGSPTDKSDFIHDYFNSNQSPRAYTVKLRATNSHGCYSEKTGTITVLEYVDAQFSIVNPTGCTPLDVEFRNTSLAPATNTNYFWDYNDNTSSGIATTTHFHKFYNESRTTDKPYRISLTVTSENYCTDTISAPIMVYHQPLAKLYVDPKSSCPPLVATMNNLDSRGYSMYRWYFGDGTSTPVINSTIGEARSYTYPNTSIDFTQNYTLKLYVESDQGCSHMDSSILNVFPDVIANFTYEPAGCSPFVTEFRNASSSPATQFFYDFKDGSTSNQDTVYHRFVNDNYIDRVFNVKLTATSDYNCWDTITKPVTVYAQPVALFNPTPVVQTFPEARVQLNSSSNNQPYTYLWTFDDGITSTSSNEIYHDYVHWGERTIILSLSSNTSNCADTDTNTIQIKPPLVNAAFTVDTDRGCEPLDVQFTARASLYTEIYTYEWDYGDGKSGTGSTPNHRYDSSGIYYVKMTAKSQQVGGGEDYEYRTIRVYKNPKANFAVAPKTTTLNTDLEARVEFFNLSECADTSGCSYLWRFGDGNTSDKRELVYYYTELGKYDVTLVVTTDSSNCVDSMIIAPAVTVIGEGQIVFPNAFTPNLESEISCRVDGGYDRYSNDIFHPVSKGVIQYELLIYNRWGELIFKSDDLGCGWNGYIDGTLAKQDVYVWKSQGKFSNGRAFEMAGDVTLIR
ncbi:MAG: hypothetical protein A2W99_00490 [Bacteroidetes bacterium GWF2_33_16]|nr:MAG: hypothetical protein A2X00_03195 [Bacteroidetes bacterium GWE2_32_14]OFY08750.1 MAG: hypothetical protein A2W99_00490 [Bacteroidetes bacterium GWF2_33_16]